jgi:K+-sensing histidine kinase KdpD
MDTDKSESLFPALLASTVHDIKSSLGVVLELIRQLALKQPPGQNAEFSQLEFEANRINHSLIQLLVMFKIDFCTFGLDIDEFSAIDVIQEARSQQDVLSKIKHIEFQIECDEDLWCYCDYAHISNAIGAILNNALRYTSTAVLMSARQEEDFVVFCIEDDGEGYPEQFLQADFGSVDNLDWVTGNTGLGLYFASVIAGMHKNKQNSGYLKIDNESRLGGARFSLYLP